jgi:hypothetical protein
MIIRCKRNISNVEGQKTLNIGRKQVFSWIGSIIK